MSNMPAFPTADCGHGAPYGGMDLRDYFAVAALTGLNPNEWPSEAYKDLAMHAYLIADVMLKVRGS